MLLGIYRHQRVGRHRSLGWNTALLKAALPIRSSVPSLRPSSLLNETNRPSPLRRNHTRRLEFAALVVESTVLSGKSTAPERCAEDSAHYSSSPLSLWRP